MTKREMMSLLIKLMGVYALVQLVPGVVQAMSLFVTGAFQVNDRPGMAVLIILVMMFLVPFFWIGLCLWVIGKSDRFAARFYPVDAPAGQLTTLGVKDIQHLGYHFIGLLLIVKSLPPFIMSLYQWITLYSLPYERRYQASGPYRSQWIVLAVSSLRSACICFCGQRILPTCGQGRKAKSLTMCVRSLKRTKKQKNKTIR